MEYHKLFTPEEEAILNHGLVDPMDWIEKMIQGKLNDILGTAYKEYRDLLVQERSSTIPTDSLEAFKEYVQRSDYTTRKFR